jgi:hypothetical protein
VLRHSLEYNADIHVSAGEVSVAEVYPMIMDIDITVKVSFCGLVHE